MLAAHGLQVRSLKLAVDELAAIVLHDVCQLYQRQFRSRRHELEHALAEESRSDVHTVETAYEPVVLVPHLHAGSEALFV